MKIFAVIFGLQLAAAAGHNKAGLRANSNTPATPLAVQADQLIHLLAQDVNDPVDDTHDHVEKAVKQDADNVEKVAKGKSPEVVPEVPDQVEKPVKKEIKAAEDAAKPKATKAKKAKMVNKPAKKEKKSKEEAHPGLKAFMPKCLVHTAKMMQQVDGSYTDLQLKTVLQNECKLSKQFPTVYDDGFKTHDSCMAFADSLTEARFDELADGSTKGYTKFCEKFYQLEVAKEGKKKVGKEDSAASALSMASMVFVAVIASLWC